jgi:hypothetical protein
VIRIGQEVVATSCPVFHSPEPGVFIMHHFSIVAVPRTGETAFFGAQSADQSAFPCFWDDDVFMAGCLDAPHYIPTGKTLFVGTLSDGSRLAQAAFTGR